jgi:hypothetical protein
VFKDSLKKFFVRDDQDFLDMGFNVVTDVQTSREVKICGALGCCASGNKKSAIVSEQTVGVSGTSSWRQCVASPSSSIAIVFDIINQHNQPIPPGQLRYTQLVTTYVHSSGESRMRVTTQAQTWVAPDAHVELAASFDQETAAAVMARWAVSKTDAEDFSDVLRWLDRTLIKLCQKFGEYRKDDPTSFRLRDTFGLYPQVRRPLVIASVESTFFNALFQFIYNLRRSSFLQVFNNSPDETAFHRVCLYRETVPNMLLMIQPSLLAYSLQEQPQAVLLDIASVSPNRILLLDSFFIVLVFYGEVSACVPPPPPSPRPRRTRSSLNGATRATTCSLSTLRLPSCCSRHPPTPPSSCATAFQPLASSSATRTAPRCIFQRALFDVRAPITPPQARFLTARVNPSVTQSSMGCACSVAPRCVAGPAHALAATAPATKSCKRTTSRSRWPHSLPPRPYLPPAHPSSPPSHPPSRHSWSTCRS